MLALLAAARGSWRAFTHTPLLVEVAGCFLAPCPLAGGWCLACLIDLFMPYSLQSCGLTDCTVLFPACDCDMQVLHSLSCIVFLFLEVMRLAALWVWLLDSQHLT